LGSNEKVQGAYIGCGKKKGGKRAEGGWGDEFITEKWVFMATKHTTQESAGGEKGRNSLSE